MKRVLILTLSIPVLSIALLAQAPGPSPSPSISPTLNPTVTQIGPGAAGGPAGIIESLKAVEVGSQRVRESSGTNMCQHN
jgi:hypothetical protein